MSVNLDFPPLKNDRVLKAARGEKPDKIPIWVMRQAGRYLPEFRELRQKHGFFEICQNPELASEVTLMPLRRFKLDAAIVFSDILVIPQALGLKVHMRPNEGPVFEEPLCIENMDRLSTEDIIQKLEYVGHTINLTRHKLQGSVPVFGFSGAPWTLFAYMVEGRGSKTYSAAKKWLYSLPDPSRSILKMLTEVIIDYLVMQVEFGAQILQVFDSNAEYLNKDMYAKYSMPYLKQISQEVRRKLREKNLEEVPMVLFAKGGWYCLEEQAELGYEVLGVDWTVDPKYVRDILKNKKITLQGNLDPCALYSSPDEVQDMVKKMINEFGTERYIANLGHGIYPDADERCVTAFVEAVHDYPC